MLDINEIIKYELPAISGFISNKYLQELIARYVGWKVSRKYTRYSRLKKLEKEFGIFNQN